MDVASGILCIDPDSLTIRELFDRLVAKQRYDWQLNAALNTVAANSTSAIVQCLTGKRQRTYKPVDFMPRRGSNESSDRVSFKEMLGLMKEMRHG